LLGPVVLMDQGVAKFSDVTFPIEGESLDVVAENEPVLAACRQ